jgi:hypothetical protein
LLGVSLWCKDYAKTNTNTNHPLPCPHVPSLRPVDVSILDAAYVPARNSTPLADAAAPATSAPPLLHGMLETASPLHTAHYPPSSSSEPNPRAVTHSSSPPLAVSCLVPLFVLRHCFCCRLPIRTLFHHHPLNIPIPSAAL